jgi:hypothetical protein
METSATERRIVVQPSRECNSEFRINAWASFKRGHDVKGVPRARRIRDAHAITRRLIGASNSAQRRDEQPKFAMDRSLCRSCQGRPLAGRRAWAATILPVPKTLKSTV